MPELTAAGVNVSFGYDCAMDPWYGLGKQRPAGSGEHWPALGADDAPERDVRLLRRGAGQGRESARVPSINFTNAHSTRFAGVAIPNASPRCTINPLR